MSWRGSPVGHGRDGRFSYAPEWNESGRHPVRRVVAKSVLAAKFVGDPVQNLLDFSAASRQTVGKQKCAATAVFSKGMENLHFDIITTVLGG